MKKRILILLGLLLASVLCFFVFRAFVLKGGSAGYHSSGDKNPSTNVPTDTGKSEEKLNSEKGNTASDEGKSPLDKGKTPSNKGVSSEKVEDSDLGEELIDKNQNGKDTPKDEQIGNQEEGTKDNVSQSNELPEIKFE